uniref:Uncharacterized protein n=1 Tax=Glossina palpalis gambiensis TaxID=67801 RepID=A0A1B0BDC8_9MUSC
MSYTSECVTLHEQRQHNERICIAQHNTILHCIQIFLENFHKSLYIRPCIRGILFILNDSLSVNTVLWTLCLTVQKISKNATKLMHTYVCMSFGNLEQKINAYLNCIPSALSNIFNTIATSISIANRASTIVNIHRRTSFCNGLDI